jgi:hypothetical protein
MKSVFLSIGSGFAQLRDEVASTRHLAKNAASLFGHRAATDGLLAHRKETPCSFV